MLWFLKMTVSRAPMVIMMRPRITRMAGIAKGKWYRMRFWVGYTGTWMVLDGDMFRQPRTPLVPTTLAAA